MHIAYMEREIIHRIDQFTRICAKDSPVPEREKRVYRRVLRLLKYDLKQNRQK